MHQRDKSQLNKLAVLPVKQKLYIIYLCTASCGKPNVTCSTIEIYIDTSKPTPFHWIFRTRRWKIVISDLLEFVFDEIFGNRYLFQP